MHKLAFTRRPSRSDIVLVVAYWLVVSPILLFQYRADTSWLLSQLGPAVEVENTLAAPLGERLAQLTTAWYQADPLAPGTGLGLWIAGRLAGSLQLGLMLAEVNGQLTARVQCPRPS